VSIDSVTEGAACTVLLAEKYFQRSNDMVIANSDQIVDIDFNEYIAFSRAGAIDGTIMVFENDDIKWSFAKLNKEGFVTEVAEKKRISNLATVGIYYYRHGTDFSKYAQQMIKKNIRVNNEFYVCPVYNECILDHKLVKTWKIERQQMHGVGTPADLEAYLKRHKK
jgi:dTDP-glucose pyrophosphorylase